MRDSDKDLQPAQGAPCADVQPTKQASITPPAIEAGSEITHKQLSPRALLRSTFSEEPQTYCVSIGAKHLDREIDFSDVYEEYHPLMAVGRAVVEIRRQRVMVSIESISVSQRIIVEKSNK